VRFFLLLTLFALPVFAKVEVGADKIFTEKYFALVKSKRVGLVTNQTGVISSFESTLSLFEFQHEKHFIRLTAIFSPEHGLYGEEHAGEKIASNRTETGIPIYSLYGETRRPSKQMLDKLDVIVYDVQDIGCRSYTFSSTLFYVMEEASKRGIPVVVLDRPNPLGGILVDGAMLEEKMRSFVGYVNIPYCHGMTIGELSSFFNKEYNVGCELTVVPMSGWKRGMRFEQTQLPWIPTSPWIPEQTSPFFYPTTGLVGELGLVSIGIGSSLPFKVVAAPWLDGKALAKRLNHGAPPGVHFQMMKVKPFTGLYSGKTCNGVFLIVRDYSVYNPIKVQYWILDGLKQLYPKEVNEALRKMQAKLPFFYKLCGTAEVYKILLKEERPFEKLVALHAKERAEFFKIRQKYLNPLYSSD
jgi:uncharacterized protein YbbC (DUF1343 family)